ncbi:MAG TPA: hypothetical protein VG944_00490 [Fimbriimonas sp.]|nr:hypothetical protein [Fimbriimonas sp.]
MLLPGLLDFSIPQWKHEKAFHIEDAYKWLFHASLGGEHAVSDMSEVRDWMDSEWKTLARPHKGEPLTVLLRPDGKLLRVNLRPYKAMGGSKEALLKVFVDSAKAFHEDRSAFRSVWQQLGKRLAKRPIGDLTEAAWQSLNRRTTPDYPAIDHSAAYESANHPAYRVVLATKWEHVLERIRHHGPRRSP